MTATFLMGCVFVTGTAAASPVKPDAVSAASLTTAAAGGNAAAAAPVAKPHSAYQRIARKIAPLSPVTPTTPITPATHLPSILAPHEGNTTTDAYAVRSDFGKSNLHKWSSVYGMDTSWDDNDVTDTAHLQNSTIAFLDTLNADARAAGVSFVITGGAERGYHAHGTYSHENGYKIDISDDGVYAGTTAYRVLLEALAPYKHHLSHEWNNNHFDITIYPADYQGSYAGANHSTEDDE